MPAGIRLLAGLVRSIAPIVNCVILDSAPVGVHEVSAIELVQMTESTKMSGSEMNASSHGTPKNACVAQAPSTLKTGTPTAEIHSGNSMCAQHVGAVAASAAALEEAPEDLGAAEQAHQRAHHHHRHAPPQRPLVDDLAREIGTMAPVGPDARRRCRRPGS